MRLKQNSQKEPTNPLYPRIISGFQIGADIAGIRAAKKCGFETGGYMPLGYLTQAGMRPDYAEDYGAEEHPLSGYPSRTIANVEAADVTIRIAYRWDSPGEICTLKAIRRYNKPWLDINPADPIPPAWVSDWILILGAQTINIAGNADYELESFVESYLTDVFTVLRVQLDEIQNFHRPRS